MAGVYALHLSVSDAARLADVIHNHCIHLSPLDCVPSAIRNNKETYERITHGCVFTHRCCCCQVGSGSSSSTVQLTWVYLLVWVSQDQDFVRKEKFDWLGFDWGRRGGLQARELALWVQLQREFRRRNLLDTDAIKRLETIGFKWEPEVSYFMHICTQCIPSKQHVRVSLWHALPCRNSCQSDGGMVVHNNPSQFTSLDRIGVSILNLSRGAIP